MPQKQPLMFIKIKFIMQLILLSGGSGKRLWPLSNNIRSKQFLPLLEKEDGSKESMVQRVVRQIQETKLTDNITIATNKNQIELIVSQLGDSVSIVAEPERRDTFPAISLATSYLKLARGCTDDEVVVIMPCDPFTDASYFQTINKMVACVEQDVADIVLMGIMPTYPSVKFGYIVPDSSNLSPAGSQTVSKFIEKPSIEIAKELLSLGAFWNGGVFAFRLGYIMSIVQKYIIEDKFDYFRDRYSELPKISFDYEVVEKAESVAVVPFFGEWKDLGTWNAFTDKLLNPIIGNASMGTHCFNTNVINELQQPIYVDGLKDIVVAASPDGILVCEKSYSENIKDVVDNLSPRPMYEELQWGMYRVLECNVFENGSYGLTKSVIIYAGKSISYQANYSISKTWTIQKGKGVLILDDTEYPVKSGDTFVIHAGSIHTIKALSPISFIEVQLGDSLKEDNIESSDLIIN